jgi:drug/metabolite transporter (DMT)-like permease
MTEPVARTATLASTRPSPGIMPAARPLLGIGLAIAATLMFAGHDTINKHLLATYDVPLVSAIRYIVHTMLMVMLLGPRHGGALVKTARTGVVIVRAICLVVGSLFASLALRIMPIAETTAIIYLAPIIVVLLARPLLDETIGLIGWIGAIGGFLGVLLIARPGAGLDPLGVAFALCNVGVTAAYYILSRILARSETTLALLFYSALAGTICFGLAAPWFWFDTMPTTLDLALFASLGLLAGVGHFCFTAAYRHAPASILAPISYTHLIWAGLFGWLVFDQLPDAIGLVGMAIIFLAGVLTALRTVRRPPIAEPTS